MLDRNLDDVLKEFATLENIRQIYLEYEQAKTDTMYFPPKVKVQMGVDGIDWKSFRANLDHHCKSIADRIISGKYFFKPFREVAIQKKGGKKGEHRLISIASISDMLVQKLIHKCIYPTAEVKFRKLSNASFAYREGYSAPLAVKYLYRYIKEGYNYVFDADIEKFFDTIPHSLLKEKLSTFAGGEDTLIYRYLKRFVSVDRVLAESYVHLEGRENIFKYQKPSRTRRKAGIPQGGVFSGLIANIYMHEFDQWVLENLGSKYDIKYMRYADDFLILYKSENIEGRIKAEVNSKLESMGLNINWGKTETKIDLLQEATYVEYVGFAVSKTGVRIKQENIRKFKLGVIDVLSRTHINESTNSLKFLITRLTFKYLGNEAVGLQRCSNCGMYESRRSWLSYFLVINDVQQLRAIDTWVRKSIYRWYYISTGKRLNAKTLRSLGLLRLEDIYRKIKAEEKIVKLAEKQSEQQVIRTCYCKPLDARKSREYLLHKLLFYNY